MRKGPRAARTLAFNIITNAPIESARMARRSRAGGSSAVGSAVDVNGADSMELAPAPYILYRLSRRPPDPYTVLAVPIVLPVLSLPSEPPVPLIPGPAERRSA